MKLGVAVLFLFASGALLGQDERWFLVLATARVSPGPSNSIPRTPSCGSIIGFKRDSRIQKPANRVLASPNSASSTPIRSIMPRYKLHNLRLSSPDSK